MAFRAELSRDSGLCLPVLLMLLHTQLVQFEQRFALDALHHGLSKVLMSHHGLEILMGICWSAVSLYVHRLGQVLVSFIKSVDILEASILLISLQRHFDFVLRHTFQLLHASHVVDCKAHLLEV